MSASVCAAPSRATRRRSRPWRRRPSRSWRPAKVRTPNDHPPFWQRLRGRLGLLGRARLGARGRRRRWAPSPASRSQARCSGLRRSAWGAPSGRVRPRVRPPRSRRPSAPRPAALRRRLRRRFRRRLRRRCPPTRLTRPLRAALRLTRPVSLLRASPPLRLRSPACPRRERCGRRRAGVRLTPPAPRPRRRPLPEVRPAHRRVPRPNRRPVKGAPSAPTSIEGRALVWRLVAAHTAPSPRLAARRRAYGTDRRTCARRRAPEISL